jgi:hypothetical protein
MRGNRVCEYDGIPGLWIPALAALGRNDVLGAALGRNDALGGFAGLALPAGNDELDTLHKNADTPLSCLA